MLELKRLSVDDGLDIYTMLQEIPAEENGLINKANGLTFDEYKEWLIVKQRDSEKEGIVDVGKCLLQLFGYMLMVFRLDLVLSDIF